MKELPHQALLFCFHYVTNGRKKRDAARDAGFSESTAQVKPATWLKDERYQQTIDRYAKMMADEITAELERKRIEAETPAPPPEPKKRGPKPKPKPEKQPKRPLLPPPPDKEEEIKAMLLARARAISAAAAEVNVDKRWVMQELTANYLRATQCETPDLTAARGFLHLIGTELGMFIRRQHVAFESLDSLTPEESEAELQRALDELGGKLPPAMRRVLGNERLQ